jgi:ribosomal protein S18 acetylase RimI-like enzyme
MLSIRESTAQDGAAILRIASAEPLFSRQEAETVAELLHDYLERADHNGYFFLTAESEGALLGFACYGPTPLTQGTFDLYWICVRRDLQRQGAGKALMQRVEDEVRQQAGRLIVLDTSGRHEYEPTRRFYENLGYTRAATLPDYYAPGDDLILFLKRLSD